MHSETSPNELTDLLAEIEAVSPVFIANIIETTAGGTTIKHGPLVPVRVEGRAVNTLPNFQSAGLAKDIDGFQLLVDKAIKDRLDRESIADKDKPIFTEEYPPSEARSETITWKLILREPATTSKGKQMNHGIQDWKPRLRAITEDPERPNKKLYIYGQAFDNIIELCCWARTNKQANKRALWLERLMHEYIWYFKYQGLRQIRYEGRGEDEYHEIESNRYYKRPLRFFVQTERMTTLSEYILREMVLDLNIDTSVLGFNQEE